MFKERDQVDSFFYDPESEIEYQTNNDPDFLYDQWKDQQLEEAMNNGRPNQ